MEVICDSCGSRTPQSLQRLICAIIVREDQLMKAAIQSLPACQLVSVLHVAVNCLAHNSVATQIGLLLEHWPYDEFNMGVVRKRHHDNGALACLILDRFAGDFQARLQNTATTSNLRHLIMRDGGLFLQKVLC